MTHPSLDLADADSEMISVRLLESFLRQLSHDVRNDLNAMELLVSYVEYEKPDGEVSNALSQLHDAIRYGARRMLRVSRAVQFPDVDSISYPLDILQEDLRERLLLEKADLASRILWERCPPNAVVQVDADLILEALIELLDNAASFSPANLKVEIGIERNNSGVLWKISQHADKCPAHLEQWGRLPLVSTRRSHYGLGLFRVRRILHAHRATLSFNFDGDCQRLVTEVVFANQE